MRALNIECPEVAKQWHPTKNGDLTPADVSAGSRRKAWWICDKGHEWEAVISSRARGNGCPYCANKKVLEGYNDLGTTNPELLSEWCYDLNTEFGPHEVIAGSGKTAWWECPKGHRWKARVVDRSKGVGCPYCSNKRVLPGFNDIATTHPELAAEWHPHKNGDTTPADVTAGSHTKFWWACPLGHEWRAAPQDRVRGTGCPICARETQTSFPEQAILWYLSKLTRAVSRESINGDECDIYLPDIESGVEYDGLYYHGASGDKDRAKKSRLKRSLSKLVTVVESDGRQTEYDGFTIFYVPDKNYCNLESVIRETVGLLGLECNVEINVENDRSSIYQAYVHRVKERSLAALKPDLAKEWHPVKNGLLKPSQVSVGSNKKVWWACGRGHAYQATVSNRVAGKNCPYCSGQKLLVGFNDLCTVAPDLANEWADDLNEGIGPTSVVAHSLKRVWWRCEKGHVWQSTVSNRFEGYGCPYCSNQKVLAGYNDLATTNPELAAEWHPTKNGSITPEDVIAGSHKKYWWVCKRGHEWKAELSDRNLGRGCPYCSSTKVLPGFNDLATINPSVAKEWHPTRNGALKPTDVMSKSNKKVWWTCGLGHEWEARIADRVGGKGCPYCGNKRVLQGYNDLATTNPSLAAEWHPTKNGDLAPTDVLAGSSKRVWWRCPHGHEWQTKISHRSAGSGCPYCRGKTPRNREGGS